MPNTTRDFNILLTVRADLQDALGKIKSVDSSLSGLKSTALELAGALGIGFSVAGLVDLVKTTIEADVQLGNMSKTLGLSTEQLSALSDQAKKSGLGLEDVQTAFVQLSKAVTGQNAEGTKALEAMGFSKKYIDDAQKGIISFAQVVQDVSGKFAGYNGGAAKAALATAALGRSGAQLIPLLDQIGNQGLNNLTRQAIAAGTAVDHNAVEAAQRFSNAIDALKLKVQGAVNEGLKQFTPEIDHLASAVDDPDFSRALKGVADDIADIASAAVKGAVEILKFYNNLEAVIGFKLDNNIDPNASIDTQQQLLAQKKQQLDDLDAQLAARQQGGILGNAQENAQVVKEAVSGASGNPLLDALDVSGVVSKANLTTEQLQVARDKLSAEIDSDKKQIERAQTDNVVDRGTNLSQDRLRFLAQQYKDKTNPPIIGSASKTDEGARQAAAALKQLQDQLAALRTQGLDPTQTAWADYNKTVDQAIAEAKAAGNTPVANATLNAVVEQAARIRDAKLDEIAKQDQKAWDDLLHSLATPAQANVQEAIDEIGQLNDLMKKGTHSAQDYKNALQGIINKALPEHPNIAGQLQGLLPQGADVDQGPIAQTFQAEHDENDNFKQSMAELQQLRAKALADAEKFGQDKVAIEQQFDDEETTLQQQHAQTIAQINDARYMAELEVASEAFGQLAQIVGQRYGTESKAYRVLFALSKSFAIAQAAVSLGVNVAKASEVGFPYNIPFIVGAFAQGVEIASIIAGAAFGGGGDSGGTGYSKGGYTGSGAVLAPAGIVHRGEVVWSQQDVARAGGVNIVEAMRMGTAYGYANGGVVGSVPVTGDLARVMAAGRRQLGPLDRAANDTPRDSNIKIVVLLDKDQAIQELLSTPAGQKSVLHIVGDNPRAIQARWGR